MKAETDSIFLQVNFSKDYKTLHVKQDMWVHNPSNQALSQLGFHAWMNAYGKKLTHLSARLLENRKSSLYFSDEKDRGEVQNLKTPYQYNLFEDEFITLDLPKQLQPNDFVELSFEYDIKIPEDFFTRYGKKDESVLLSYFNIQPVKFYKEGKPEFTHYLDLETLPLQPTYYKIELLQDFDKVASNLPRIDNNTFEGYQLEQLTLVINPESLYSYTYKNTTLELAFPIDEEQLPYVQKTIERQLNFMEEVYHLQLDKILLHSKLKKLENFVGVDDIEVVSKIKIRFFTAEQQIDLKLFKMMSYQFLKQRLNIDFEKDHWIIHGFQVYMSINYIEKFYPDLKLAGMVPEKIRIGKFKPLKLFFASDLNLTDRYKLLYLYIVRLNYVQSIDTEFHEFSNLNQLVVSGFKTGIGLDYLSKYLGGQELNDLTAKYFSKKDYTYFTAKEFQAYLEKNSTKDLTWFFDDFIKNSNRLNLKLKGLKESEDSLQLKIENRTNFTGPFYVAAYNKNKLMESQWMKTKGEKAIYSFPLGDYDKIAINPGYMFPEYNDRDNYVSTKGLFKNMKKFKPIFYGDIENPEYNQLFYTPTFKWNNYDKFILGVNITNYTLFDKKFEFQASPSFSTGTKDLTGSGRMKYNTFPVQGAFRNISFTANFSYYHWNRDLNYFTTGVGTKFSFNKDPRSSITRNIFINYNYFDKERDPLDSLIDVDSYRYNIGRIGYFYRDDKMILEKALGADLEVSDLFQKVNIEAFLRWEYIQGRKVLVRWFGSVFLDNNTTGDYFDTSISRISDYSFGYNLLARSDTSGFLSQQYVLAEGGFVTYFDNKADQFITTLRTEAPIWKFFHFFGGVGLYKNKLESPNFIYEAGLKLNLIPDFFQIYVPAYSNFGWSWNEGEYYKTIRFRLQADLSHVISYFRRGLF